MASRESLQTLLESIMGSNFVYFQPPESLKMEYPAIVYTLAYVDTAYANNSPYTIQKRYLLTLIDRNPDSTIIDKLLQLPACSFDRYFVKDNLNHYTYDLYY